jgi:hypothetical protein
MLIAAGHKFNGTPITQAERIYSDKKSTKHQTRNTKHETPNTKHLPLSLFYPLSFILYPLSFILTLYPFPKMFTFVELHFLCG